jgi:hypothetical protein
MQEELLLKTDDIDQDIVSSFLNAACKVEVRSYANIVRATLVPVASHVSLSIPLTLT